MIGQTISHYKILEKLGEGGMGAVYLAEDTELDRKVALKFLPTGSTDDPEIRARFKREAKAAAALNHPNIVTIHEIGEHEGQAFLVMEYVEGQSLKDVVGAYGDTPLPMSKIIDIASQICEGLAAAHNADVVHRDIKPDNVLITADGRAKIADFGLAKLKGVTRLTKEDTTMGTVYYMSPEQAVGEDVDRRSDIFSLGVVLYEMITGQLPFGGEYEAAISYSILHEEPEPLARYKAGVSEGLQRIVEKALDKEKDTRYQNAADLLADLKREKKSSSASMAPAQKVKESKLDRRSFVLFGFIAFVVLLALFTIDKLQRESVRQVLATHTQLTFTGKASYPAISPDGQFMAYISGEPDSDGGVSNGKLMVHDIKSGQAIEVFSGAHARPHGWGSLQWSPDGSKLLFQASAGGSYGTYVIPRLGGSPHRIGPMRIACWSPDGSMTATALPRKRIRFTNISTGDTSSISLAADFLMLTALDWSPMGDRLLFLTVGKGEQAIRTIRADGSQEQTVVKDSIVLKAPHWSSNGRNIYYYRYHAETKELLKIKVDPESGKAEGPTQLLQAGLQTGDVSSLSSDGQRLLYTRGLVWSNLWLVPLQDPDSGQTVETKQLTTGTSWIRQPRISPDGKRVAFSVGSRPKANIFVMPLEGGPMQQLTFRDSYNSSPVWSPDGKYLAFGSTEAGKSQLWIVAADGGMPRQFEASQLSVDVFDLTWYPGSDILYRRPGNRNFHLVSPRTGEERPLISNNSVGWMFRARHSRLGTMLRYTGTDGSEVFG